MEAEETCSQLRKQVQRHQTQRLSMSPYHGAVAMSGSYDIQSYENATSINGLLEEARKDVSRQKKRVLRYAGKSKDVENDNQDTNGNDVEGQEEVNGDNGFGDGDTDDANSEDSDTEQQDAIASAEFALVELTNEISVKEKLIIELEKSQRKMNTMKHHYEEKLLQLQKVISETEAERDRVLAKLGVMGSTKNDDQAKKIRSDYEKKLNNLQNEMRKLQVAQREHSQSLKNSAAYEQKVKQIKMEVANMKKEKVKLLSRIKEESKKYREAELRHTKRITQLTKLDRQKDVKIRSLENASNRFKTILQRKEEVCVSGNTRVCKIYGS